MTDPLQPPQAITPMSDAHSLRVLAERVEVATGFDNSLDVECELALFEPSAHELAIRKNDAASKVIVTFAGKGQRTFIARDYTISANARAITAAALRARAAYIQEQNNAR